MRTPTLLSLALLLSTAASAQTNTAAGLDAAALGSVVQCVATRERVVGASVLGARDDRILLHQGYAFADLGLEAPTRDEAVYHNVGAMPAFTGFAVMQQVERGKLQ